MKIDCSQVLDGARDGKKSTQLMLLCKCYMIGERRGATEFRNEIMDALVTFCLPDRRDATNHAQPNIPGKTAVTYVFEHTLPASKLRMLFVDIWAWFANRSRLMAMDATGFPAEFICACFKAFLTGCHEAGLDKDGLLKNEVSPLLKRCEIYHEHADGENCHGFIKLEHVTGHAVEESEAGVQQESDS